MKSTHVDEFNYGEESKPVAHFRTKKDNPYLVGSQIVDIENYVDGNTINVIDADTLAFQVASSVEDDYIEVKFIRSGKIVATLKNVTEFKGRSRTSVSTDSWLGNFNVKQEAKGKPTLTVEDFEIIPKKKLKHENGCEIDDQRFLNSLDVMKYYIDSWVEAIKVQTTVDKILPILGEGKVHRHFLPLPEPYKDKRDGERPLLLKDAREYILTQYSGKMAKEGFEADEVVDAYGKRGYEVYKKTGKFKYIKSSPDKDASNKEGLWFNYSKDFNFKIPQPYLVKSEDECVGSIALDKDKIRGLGLKHMCYQLLMGDSADKYGPRAYLPEEVRPNVKYGTAQFYKDFYGLTTQKEVLQKTVDLFYDWFPEGVAYISWDGRDVSFDTLSYIELMFSCAYMKVSPKDTTTFEDSLKKFEVDYSKIVGNRITENSELVEEDVLKKIVHETKGLIEEALSEVEKKSGTKSVMLAKLENTERLLKDINEKLRSMFQVGG